MSNVKLAWGASILAATAALVSPAANATVMGTAFFATGGQSQNASIGATAGLPVEATFGVPQPNPGCTGAFLGSTLCFSSYGKGVLTGNQQNAYTLGSYLSTGGATVTSGSASLNNMLSSDSTTGTLFEFTGTVSATTGQVFTVNHDDGVSLKIGNQMVINDPGSGSTVTTATYTGPSGDLPFDLVYSECCGGGAQLGILLPLATEGVGAPSPVPEPTSLAILGSALIGFGTVRRRRKSA